MKISMVSKFQLLPLKPIIFCVIVFYLYQNKEATDKGQTERLSSEPSVIPFDVPVDALVLDIPSEENSEVEDEPQLLKPAEEPPPEVQTKKVIDLHSY